jgi:hypothetical protein
MLLLDEKRMSAGVVLCQCAKDAREEGSSNRTSFLLLEDYRTLSSVQSFAKKRLGHCSTSRMCQAKIIFATVRGAFIGNFFCNSKEASKTPRVLGP